MGYPRCFLRNDWKHFLLCYKRFSAETTQLNIISWWKILIWQHRSSCSNSHDSPPAFCFHLSSLNMNIPSELNPYSVWKNFIRTTEKNVLPCMSPSDKKWQEPKFHHDVNVSFLISDQCSGIWQVPSPSPEINIKPKRNLLSEPIRALGELSESEITLYFPFHFLRKIRKVRH